MGIGIDWSDTLQRLKCEKRRVLTVGEVAEIFQVTMQHVLNLVEEGKIGAINLSSRDTSKRYLRIPVDDLILFAHEQHTLGGGAQAIEKKLGGAQGALITHNEELVRSKTGDCPVTGHTVSSLADSFRQGKLKAKP